MSNLNLVGFSPPLTAAPNSQWGYSRHDFRCYRDDSNGNDMITPVSSGPAIRRFEKYSNQ